MYFRVNRHNIGIETESRSRMMKNTNRFRRWIAILTVCFIDLKTNRKTWWMMVKWIHYNCSVKLISMSSNSNNDRIEYSKIRVWVHIRRCWNKYKSNRVIMINQISLNIIRCCQLLINRMDWALSRFISHWIKTRIRNIMKYSKGVIVLKYFRENGVIVEDRGGVEEEK